MVIVIIVGIIYFFTFYFLVSKFDMLIFGLSAKKLLFRAKYYLLSQEPAPATKWLLCCYRPNAPRQPLDRAYLNSWSCINKLMGYTNTKFAMENIIFHQYNSYSWILYHEGLSSWPGLANQPGSNRIETLWIFCPRYNCQFLFILKWIEWRRLVMMADLRDRASALVMNGLRSAQSISQGESENAIPQLKMIHSGKPRFFDCQPLQSSLMTNSNILCMNELRSYI